jgi:hypothetical protein
LSRGKSAPEGATYVAQNGYHYTKRDGKFVATHKLIVEEKLGRPLAPSERVRFIDNDRQNLDPKNLKVVVKGKSSLATQRARLVARRDELNAQIAEIDKQMQLHEDRARLAQLESEGSV